MIVQGRPSIARIREEGSGALGERKKIYDLISEYASHASYPGITLTTRGPANVAQVGPFFDKDKLAPFHRATSLRVSHAAVILASNPEGEDRPLLATRQRYLTVVNKWYLTYRNMTPQAKP